MCRACVRCTQSFSHRQTDRQNISRSTGSSSLLGRQGIHSPRRSYINLKPKTLKLVTRVYIYTFFPRIPGIYDTSYVCTRMYICMMFFFLLALVLAGSMHFSQSFGGGVTTHGSTVCSFSFLFFFLFFGCNNQPTLFSIPAVVPAEKQNQRMLLLKTGNADETHSSRLICPPTYSRGATPPYILIYHNA